MIKQYRKKPVVIEAMEFTGREDNYKDLMKFIPENTPVMYERAGITHVDIETLEGTMTADEGDYLIRGVKGEFYPCKPDIFKATYEEIPKDEMPRPDIK